MYGKDVLGGTPAWWNTGLLGKALATGSTLLNALVSYWPLNEQSGTRVDVVGANDLTDNNTVLAVNRGPSGTVASFVAANSESLQVATPATTKLGNSRSLGFWFDAATPGATPGLAQIDNAATHDNPTLYIQFTNTRTVRFYHGVGYRLTSAPLSSGWHHILFAYEHGVGWEAYVDGVSVGSGADQDGATPDDFLFFGSGAFGYSDTNIAGAGLWSVRVSDAEALSLFASGVGKRYADLTADEKTGLVSYWNLDEASGNRADSHGTNHLTDNNTVGSATSVNGAMDGAAASFVAANSESLSKASLALPGGDLTVALWFNHSGTVTAYSPLISAHNSWAAETQFEIWKEDGTTRMNAGAGDGSGLVIAQTGNFTAGEWHLLIAQYSSTTGKVSVSLDNASFVDSAALASARYSTATLLEVGHWGVTANYFDGQLDEVAIWSRVLTSDERTELFAAGDGKFYPFP